MADEDDLISAVISRRLSIAEANIQLAKTQLALISRTLRNGSYIEAYLKIDELMDLLNK